MDTYMLNAHQEMAVRMQRIVETEVGSNVDIVANEAMFFQIVLTCSPHKVHNTAILTT